MIISQTGLELEQKIHIIKLDLAFDSTFVMLYSYQKQQKMLSQSRKIMNFGDNEWSFQLEEPIQTFLMIDQERMLYVLTQAQRMVLFNLRTKQRERTVQCATLKVPLNISMFYFGQTKTDRHSLGFSLDRQRRKNTPIFLLLTKFSILQSLQQRDAHEEQQSLWMPEKGNDKSLLIFTKISFFQGSHNILLYQFAEEDGRYYRNSKILEYTPIRNTFRYKFRQIDQQSLLGVSSEIFSSEDRDVIILNTVDNSVKQGYLQFQTSETGIHVQFLKDAVYLQTTINPANPDQKPDIFFTSKYPPALSLITWKRMTNQIQYCFASTDESSILQAQTLDSMSLRWLFRKIAAFDIRDIQMYFLLHLDEDFDDDLLLDAMRLMVHISQQMIVRLLLRIQKYQSTKYSAFYS